MKKRSLKFNDKAKDFLKSMCFLSPSLLGVGVFFIIPFFVVVYYSVIDGVGSRNFVFLDNFVKLFHNSAFLTAAKNTLTFSFLAVPLAVILSGEHWVDVMKPGVNKGCAMRGIQQKLGISAAECMAFGDYLNDCELLQAVGESYAMENAHPALKALARHIAPSNDENGVMRVVRERLGLAEA